MRLFVSIDFNQLDSYLSGLQKQIPPYAKPKLTRDFHITLKFLGEVGADKASMIIGLLKNISFDSFSVSLHSIGVFPSESNIRVIWVGVNPEDEVLNLQNSIDSSLSSIFEREDDFKPHITLARVGHIENKTSFINGLKEINVDNKKIGVDGFRLMESDLTPQGPLYKEICEFNCD